MTSIPRLTPQEIPFDHPHSDCMFRVAAKKPLEATPAAIAMYSCEVIVACWQLLADMADKHAGLYYLQLFESDIHNEHLVLLDYPYASGGAVQALLRSELASLGLSPNEPCRAIDPIRCVPYPPRSDV